MRSALKNRTVFFGREVPVDRSEIEEVQNIEDGSDVFGSLDFVTSDTQEADDGEEEEEEEEEVKAAPSPPPKKRPGRPPKRPHLADEQSDVAQPPSSKRARTESDKHNTRSSTPGSTAVPKSPFKKKGTAVKKLTTKTRVVKKRVVKKPAVEEPEEDDTEYEVEKIVDSQVDAATLEHFYLVKWKGYGNKDNTWEPRGNLLKCRDMILKFEETIKKAA